jgi:proteasome lid subunit RPN8/RPN11
VTLTSARIRLTWPSLAAETRRLVIPPEIQDALAAHAEAALPREAVRLIGGTNCRALLLLPLPNLAGQWAFLADPFAQYLALHRLREAKLELLATYHSHPFGSVLPSLADTAFARLWTCPHVIIALARPHQPRIEMSITTWTVPERAVTDKLTIESG